MATKDYSMKDCFSGTCLIDGQFVPFEIFARSGELEAKHIQKLLESVYPSAVSYSYFSQTLGFHDIPDNSDFVVNLHQPKEYSNSPIDRQRPAVSANMVKIGEHYTVQNAGSVDYELRILLDAIKPRSTLSTCFSAFSVAELGIGGLTKLLDDLERTANNRNPRPRIEEHRIFITAYKNTLIDLMQPLELATKSRHESPVDCLADKLARILEETSTTYKPDAFGISSKRDVFDLPDPFRSLRRKQIEPQPRKPSHKIDDLLIKKLGR
ncbi:MAG: hypothetical protein AABX38_01830 [Candidatus Micrarchaeota archaeon]